MNKTTKIIITLLGMGGLGGLAWYFSKKASEIEDKNSLSGDFNPLKLARDQGRQMTIEEIDDYYHLWGVHPDLLQKIVNYDNSDRLMRCCKVPEAKECRERIGLLKNRNIDWTYVKDFYYQFPQYQPPDAAAFEDADIVGMTKAEYQNLLYKYEGGSLHSLWDRSIPLGNQTLRVRRSQNRFENLPEAHKEEAIRDFYSVYHYDWRGTGDSAKGKAVLIGLGGFAGFMTLWRPYTQAQIIRLIKYHYRK